MNRYMFFLLFFGNTGLFAGYTNNLPSFSNVSSEYATDILVDACSVGDLDTADCVLSNCKSIFSQDDLQQALRLTIETGSCKQHSKVLCYSEIVSLLVQHGTNVNYTNSSSGYSPLKYASVESSKSGNTNVLMALLDNGAKLEN